MYIFQTRGSRYPDTKTLGSREYVTYDGHLAPVLVLTSSWMPEMTHVPDHNCW